MWQSPCTGGTGTTRGAAHVLSPVRKEKYVVFLSNRNSEGLWRLWEFFAVIVVWVSLAKFVGHSQNVNNQAPPVLFSF